MNISFALGIIIQRFILLFELCQLWPLGALPVASGVSLNSPSLWVFSLIPPYLDALCSFCTFPDPVLESAISPRIPGFFYWRMVPGTKIWVLGVSYILT